MGGFISRTLTYVDERGSKLRRGDSGVEALSECVVILGEPGSGKTELLRQIGMRSDTQVRTASAFVNHPKPASLVSASRLVIVDGLDELAAARDADPVNKVLRQLIIAGCPRFIISCRSAEWRGASARQELRDEYGVTPLELTLEGFSDEEAKQFLEGMLSAAEATKLVDDLSNRGLGDLYRNPLTLRLMGEIVSSGKTLPTTRAALLRDACSVMRAEPNPKHDLSALALLTEDVALTSAGAICATLILTGNETVSKGLQTSLPERSIHFTEIAALPGGKEALAVVGSRLFVPAPDGDGLFRPIHRSVAEFLGARWLTKALTTQEARDRLLGLLTIDSGVPSSLRGIHAWLPHFDSRFLRAVVSIDPYGVLRYGDADNEDPTMGKLLLESLIKLQRDDPFFRAEDWGTHTAKALAQPALESELKTVLIADETTTHLRTLLLQAIRGSEVAKALKADLLEILMSAGQDGYYYSERSDAVDALVDLSDGQIAWPKIVEDLQALGDHDSTRLAIDIMGAVDFEGFTPQQIASAVAGHLGLLPGTSEDEERVASGTLYSLPKKLADQLVPEVLDALQQLLQSVDPEVVRQTRSELATLIIRLIARYVMQDHVEPLRMAGWLRIVRGHYGYTAEGSKKLAAYLAAQDNIRRTIQRHVIFEETDYPSVWSRLMQLNQLNAGLVLTADDAIFFLNEIAWLPPTPEHDAVWRDLLAFSRRSDGRGEDIIAAAERYVGDRPGMHAELQVYREPRVPQQWEVEDEQRQLKWERKRLDAWEKHRADYLKNEPALRAGERSWTVAPAQCYLGLFNDVGREAEPPDRIGEWLGADLQKSALAGFEAILHRDDLPSLEQVANSYAESKRWNLIYPIISGFAERVRTGAGFGGLPEDLILIARIGIQQEHLEEHKTVASVLDAYVRSDANRLERYLRYLIEPALRGNHQHVVGLYAFVREQEDQELAVNLASRWLVEYPNLRADTESELIDPIADAEKFDLLRQFAMTRLQSELDPERKSLWLAVQFLVDFPVFKSSVQEPVERRLIWYIRHRLGGDRHAGRKPPSTKPLQLSWVVQQFRSLWPMADRPSGVTSGSENEWDGADFLQTLINRLASDPSDGAGEALTLLRDAAIDGYTPALRHAAGAQRRVRREANYKSASLAEVAAVIRTEPPRSTVDLQTVALQALQRVQAELRGSDTDAIKKYYKDDGSPRDENECTDRVIESMREFLAPYGIQAIPERDMQSAKRADIVLTLGELGLPIECKGQWNPDLWDAATDQLEEFYLPDWRAQGRGIYLVYWFGADVAKRKPTKPIGDARPANPAELKARLIQTLGSVARASIAIEILDLSR